MLVYFGGSGLGNFLILLAMLFPFIAMPLLWRRMKRVRAQAYRQSKPERREQHWEEGLGADGGRRHAPNDDLIGLGEKSRHGRWPLDNQ
ncbi:hypothetical protein D1610_06555 [Sphingomonas gilva]|uniref:Uncharacterized protein n=1 Tax=Sphingomonas gilva TaxID=2305907 RepID=A0A396RWQ2_9SPHN|nr:hypothetical protein [Sphingomonas gilva]RHW18141.1 hypothetical protein D1610_06555 [Sphingomonas gilva]